MHRPKRQPSSSSRGTSNKPLPPAPPLPVSNTPSKQRKRRQDRQQRKMGKPLADETNREDAGVTLPPLVRTLSKDLDRDELMRQSHSLEDEDDEEDVEEEPLEDAYVKPPPKIRGLGHTTSEGNTGHANEDRYLVKRGPHFHLFAVMDGHGGHIAAEFVVDRLYETLEVVYKKSGFDKTQDIQVAVDALDRTFLGMAARQQDDSGACFNAVVLYYSKEDQEYRKLVLNCGDCRAIARVAPEKSSVRRGNGSWRCADDRYSVPIVALSDDHCASNRSEKLRALEAGAFIRNNRIAGILEPFRSIGDLDMKGKSMKGWVIPTPEVRSSELIVGKTTIIVATDGVWSVLTNQRAMLLALQEIADGGDEQTAAEAVAEEAREVGSSDDITVLVISV